MNQLQTTEFNGTKVIDSRDVAVMVERNHNELLKSIRTYAAYLREGEVAQSNFFIESTYLNAQNHETPNYLITKKGCDMIANKMIGKKGVLFTAAYVSAFEEMREAIKGTRQNISANKPACIEDVLIQSLQEMKEVKFQLATTNKRIDGIRDVVALNPTAWRDDARRLIVGIAHKWGGNEHIRDVNNQVYELVDSRGGVNLATRLQNKRQRMAAEGVCKTKRDAVTKVDIIAEDKKLVEIYLAIVKEMAVKNEAALFA